MALPRYHAIDTAKFFGPIDIIDRVLLYIELRWSDTCPERNVDCFLTPLLLGAPKCERWQYIVLELGQSYLLHWEPL